MSFKCYAELSKKRLSTFFLDTYYLDVKEVAYSSETIRFSTIELDRATTPEICARHAILNKGCGPRFFYQLNLGYCNCEKGGNDPGIAASSYHNQYRLDKSK